MPTPYGKQSLGTLSDLRNHILRLRRRAGGALGRVSAGQPVVGLVQVPAAPGRESGPLRQDQE